MNVVETKTIDGEIIVSEYEEVWQVNKNMAVDDVFPTDDISYVNVQTSKDGVVKLYQNIHISTIHISHGTPTFMQSTDIDIPPPSKKCGGCPGR